MDQLQAKAIIQISKPIDEVFEAIVDPRKMSNYFISEGSGRMEEGKTLTWKFPEFEERVEVEVTKVEAPELVSFYWEGATGRKLEVAINLQEMKNSTTLVKITEGKMENDPAGLAWFGSNTEGWANFLACLKAWLEYGIHLRRGAFGYRADEG
mgnify:CR=1 FL=1